MRNTTIALIEFHWIPTAPPRARKPAPPRQRARPAPTVGGYQLPGGAWRAFLGGDIYCCGGSPIVFLHAIPDEEAPAEPRAIWHRIH